MPEIVFTEDMVALVAHFCMVLARCSALFIISPIFGRQNIPGYAKIILGVFMSVVMMFTLPSDGFPAYTNIVSYVTIVALEVVIGLVIGFITTMFFSICFIAGQIIDMQIGFGMVQVFDASANIQIPIVGSLLNMMMLLSFIISDGHRNLIRLLHRSFDIIPIGQLNFRPELGIYIGELLSTVFLLAMSVALPVLAASLLAELALGIITRTAPQMNVFIVGMPLKVIIGIIMLIVTVPVFAQFTSGIFDNMYEAFGNVFEGMAPA